MRNVWYQMVVMGAMLFWLGCSKNKGVQAPGAVIVSVVANKKVDAFNWVQFGNMPLVISVPHGGTLRPDSIPDRTCPNITTALDLNTIELAQAIDSVFWADHKIRPYLVTTTLHRSKLDQNRDWAEATCSTNSKTYLWNNFHHYIDTCIQKALAVYPSCLYIDLHGHGHAKDRLELGYLIGATALRSSATLSASNSSLVALVGTSGKTIQQLLTGPTAFGTLINNQGFAAVPSNADPAPLASDPYFDGGYNTNFYTHVSQYPKVYGWQIESHYTPVRNTASNRANFAKAFVAAVLAHYNANTNTPSSGFGK